MRSCTYIYVQEIVVQNNNQAFKNWRDSPSFLNIII